MQSTKKLILIPDQMGYGKAIKGLGELSGDIGRFYSKPADFSMVLFTGGSDVSPELYNDTSPLGVCQVNKARDTAEVGLFQHAQKHNIKMAGICRGIQFLNVMSGGSLLHDITCHNNGHHSFKPTHQDWDIIQVNSLHHQMMIPPPNGYIIGTAPYRISNHYIGFEDRPVKWPGKEVEAVLIPETKCVGVQYHPEMMADESGGYKFFYTMIKHFLEMTLTYFTKWYTEAEEVSYVS